MMVDAEPGTGRKPYLRLNLTLSFSEVSRARAGVARALQALGHPDLVSDAMVISSELVTNAVTAQTQGRVIFAVWGNRGRPLVEVWDTAIWTAPRLDPPPIEALMDMDESDLGGWGLANVQTLAAHWGHRLAEFPGEPGVIRKCVWALLK
ncbi:ATP-binding protein [Actinomadura barringtoniae]|uniref:ATP-binding protein n=1 Tax=Actinomadura barringtoniae TaxID=1427535 RepID=A0A939PSB1_9ACTN|nr:ATP-binding protein [Actinomadura barringtoniae]MBO2454189.1 ATP-binding protein [Actinomadura barringtoniae]